LEKTSKIIKSNHQSTQHHHAY